MTSALLPDGISNTEELVAGITQEHKKRNAQRAQLLNDYDSVNSEGKDAISKHAAYIASLPMYKTEEYDPDPEDIPSEWSDASKPDA